MGKLRAGCIALASVAILAAPSPGISQDVEITSKALKINIGGRVQMQGRRSSCSAFSVEAPCNSEVRNVNWFIRRARLSVFVVFNGFIEGKFAPEFAPATDSLDASNLTDAYGQLNFSDAAKLRFGHFKRPFDGFQMTSSTQILTIERDIDVPGVSSTRALSLDELTERFKLSNRNVGIGLNGETANGFFEYWVGVFNGNSSTDNQGATDGKQFMGRAQISVDAAGLPLTIAAAGAVTEEPFDRPVTGQRAGKDYSNFELWTQLGGFPSDVVRKVEAEESVGIDDQLAIQGELFFGQNPLLNRAGDAIDLPAGDDFARAWAFQVIGGWAFPIRGSSIFRAIQAVFRATYADPNTDGTDDANWGLTPGIQVFFAERQKLVVNWDFVVFEGDLRSVNSFKAQYQFYF
jgi:hypothetical protein